MNVHANAEELKRFMESQRPKTVDSLNVDDLQRKIKSLEDQLKAKEMLLKRQSTSHSEPGPSSLHHMNADSIGVVVDNCVTSKMEGLHDKIADTVTDRIVQAMEDKLLDKLLRKCCPDCPHRKVLGWLQNFE